MKTFSLMLFSTLLLAGCAGRPPAHLGVTEGRLSPCPDRPNCVSSQAPDPDHYVEPLSYEGSREEARQRLKQVITDLPRAVITAESPAESPDYIRAEFTSALFRFVDDVEFYFPEEPVIHVRSASRLGYSDLGVNRQRVETIRERLAAP